MTNELSSSTDSWKESVESFNIGEDLKPLEGRHYMSDKNIEKFFGHGKILLSGEYFVLDGALSLALPTRVGQSLTVKYSPSFNPKLTWKSFDVRGRLWLEIQFEFWHFDFIHEESRPEALMLQKILRQVRNQNKHFLRDNVDVYVETQLGFPLDWGLGSSSTLIYNIAQWAYVSPFELQFKTYGGSGYDIACAQSGGPILYRKNKKGPNWSPIIFEPEFVDNLFFVYLGHKQNSREAIDYYKKKRSKNQEFIEQVSDLTREFVKTSDFNVFEKLLENHEDVVSSSLSMTCAKERFFKDYWGVVKSLGAWGGDFVLATSNRAEKETRNYFESKGYPVVLPYRQLILEGQTPSLRPTNGEKHSEYFH